MALPKSFATSYPLTAVATDPMAADTRDMATRGEGEEGEEREQVAALESLDSKQPLAVDSDAMIKTKDWLRKQRLTAAIAYFMKNEEDLESMLELTEEQFDKWVSELPLDTLQKVRLRKGVAKLRVEAKTQSQCTDTPAKASAMAVYNPITTHFTFDPFTRDMSSQPEFFRISADLKTATATDGISIVVLKPIMEGGTHSLHFYITELNWRANDLSINVCSAHGTIGWDTERVVGFDSRGAVYVGDKLLTEYGKYKRFSFGGWKKGDHIKVVLELDNCMATIHSPYGKHSISFLRRYDAVRFLFQFNKKTTISIVV